MIVLDLATVAAAVTGELRGDRARPVDAVMTDSRAPADGPALFVALRGEHADGHGHLAAARAAGAVAALVERVDLAPDGLDVIVVDDTWRAVRDLAAHVRRVVAPRTVAITGSVGKTTVKDLAAAAVGAGRRVTAARGSFNNELGVPLTVLSCTADTEVLVAEVGARHVGDIAALAPVVAPDVAVVTAVAPVHLEIFGSLEAVARAKGELVESLGPGGCAILNHDDPLVAAMADRAPSSLTFSADGHDDADLAASDVTLDDLARASFTARTPWGEARVTVPVAGRHQVGNALAALAVAGTCGVDLAAAAAAIAGAAVSPWRGEIVRTSGVTVLSDAYNANPTSTIAALETLAALRPDAGRTVAVLGVMAEIGPTHDREHARVGAAAVATGADELVVVGADAAALADGARDAGLDAERITYVDDADAASRHLAATLGDGDVVLVKASRVAGLERVADALIASAPAATLRTGGDR